MYKVLIKNFLFNIMYLKIIILIILIIFLVFISSNIKENFTNKNYKVALCISGAIRNKEIFCNSIIEKIVKPYNPDIFICVYDGNNPNESKYLYDTLKPVTMMVHNKKPQKIENKDFLENSVSMFEKIYLCNELKKEHENKHNFKYDAVIRIRPDLIIKSDFKIDFNNLCKDSIYVPEYYGNKLFLYYSNITNLFGLGTTDQLLYGSSKSMDVMSYIYKELGKLNDNCILPEIVLKNYLKKNNLKINFFELNWMIIDYNFDFDNINTLNNNKNNVKKFLKKIKNNRLACLY